MYFFSWQNQFLNSVPNYFPSRCLLSPVLHNIDAQPDAVLVYTLVELATKELDSHDGEDEPEDEADQQHIDDGGDGVHQGIHHNLSKWWQLVKHFSEYNITSFPYSLGRVGHVDNKPSTD